MEEANFCLRCGQALEMREAFGALRPVCARCGRVHFFDPKVAVGALVERDARLLLIRRAVNPERGRWSIPAGFVDAGEDPARAVARELLEETGLRAAGVDLFDVISKAQTSEGADILIVYRVQVEAGDPVPGDDAAEAGFFSPHELPDLAFASTRRVVARWQTGGTNFLCHSPLVDV